MDVREWLTALYGNDSNARSHAETRLKESSGMNGFCRALCQVAVDEGVFVYLRQGALVVLKNCILDHWSTSSRSFSPPQCSDEDKLVVRQTIPALLSHSETAIRTASAMVIAVLSLYDFPHQWPTAFEDLSGLLATGPPTAACGVVECLSIWITHRHLTPAYLPPLIKSVFPLLFQLLENPNYSPSLKGKVFSVLHAALHWIALGDRKSLGPQAEAIIKEWMGPLVMALQQPDQPDGSIADFKRSALETLTVIVSHFPEIIRPDFEKIYQVVWGAITSSMPLMQLLVKGEGTGEGEEELIGQWGALWKWMEAALCHRAFAEIIQQNGLDLVHAAIHYAQITEEEQIRWSDDVSAYILDDTDDDETFVLSESLRGCSLKAIRAFLETLRRKGVEIVGQGITSLATQASCSPDQWKLVEGTAWMVGSLANDIMSVDGAFDAVGFVNAVLIPPLSVPLEQSNNFLRGRALSCAGRLSSYLPPELCQSFVDAALATLSTPSSGTLKVAACRAISSFCADRGKQVAMRADGLLKEICNFLVQQRDISAEMLHVTLLALDDVLKATKGEVVMSKESQGEITRVLVAMWHRRFSDPTITSDIRDVFRIMLRLEGGISVLSESLVPTLLTILKNTPPDSPIAAVIPTSLAILQEFVVVVPEDHPMLKLTFVPTVLTLSKSNESGVMEAATDVISGLVSAVGSAIVEWDDLKEELGGVTPLSAVLSLVDKLLGPSVSDSAALSVGDLICSLVLKCSDHLGGDLIQKILAATVTRFLAAKLDSLRESLLFVFIRLLYFHYQSVVQFLQTHPISVPSPSPSPSPSSSSSSSSSSLSEAIPSLQYIVNQWVGLHFSLIGSRRRKASSVGLCALVQGSAPLLASLPSMPYLRGAGNCPVCSGAGGNAKGCWHYGHSPLIVDVVSVLLKEHQRVFAQQMLAEGEEEDDEGEDDDYIEFEDGNEADFLASLQQQMGNALPGGGQYDEVLSAILGGLVDDEEDDREEEEEEGEGGRREDDPLREVDVLARIQEAMVGVQNVSPQMIGALASALPENEKHVLGSLLTH